MKTQILRLELHDDFISARDKMGWSQTGRILLVWPEHSHILNRRLDLILLQRHSNALGAQLCLITDETDVKYHAKKIGIPIFSSIQKAQKSHWRVDHHLRRNRDPFKHTAEPRPDLEDLQRAAHPETPKILLRPETRLVFFALGVLALLSIAAVLVPAAEINLEPKLQTQVVTIDVQAKPEIGSINLSGSIPSRVINVIVEGRDSTRSQGIISVPQEYATGRIQFKNLTDQPLQIPAATVVRTLDNPPIRFATTDDVELSAGVGETVSVSLQAIEPGDAGNLDPNSLVAVESELGASLTATNLQRTRGGEDRILSIATQTNREQLYDNLEEELRQTAIEEMKQLIAPGDILFTPTITISQIIAKDYDPVADLPSDQLSLSLRVEYEAMYSEGRDLEQLAQYALDASIPEMFQAQPDTLTIETISIPMLDEQGVASWRIQAERQIRARILESQAINQSLGLTPDIARDILSTTLPLMDEPLIKISPSWWPRLPILPFRFEVKTME